MSTTFGVEIPSTGEIKPVARRIGMGNGEADVFFTEPLAELLPHKLRVVPMDNSAQGINTIGDIVLANLQNK